jgi:hypothetical protein
MFALFLSSRVSKSWFMAALKLGALSECVACVIDDKRS